MDWRENQFVEVGLAIMADRKSRSVTFRGIFNISVGAMKTAFESITSQEITVFQSLGKEEFLLELTSKNAAELLIDEGFDVNEFHVCCHPPHGYFTNVSIMGLRSYVEDAQILEALAKFVVCGRTFKQHLSFVTHKLSTKRVCYLVYLSRMTKVPHSLRI